ncbi:MAG: hypothetical protein JNM22_06950 [Saprospiraceae bacterium]|nr:hypothetical protein [Saprospiraceae bacterium]
MEQSFVLTEDMLWDYADGFLSPVEKAQVDDYLRQHPEQHARLDAIMAEKRNFSALALEHPDAGFADRVLAAWATEQGGKADLSAEKSRDWIAYGIGGLLAGFLFLLIVLIFASAPEATPMGIEPTDYIPSIPWAKIFSSPIARFGMPFALLFVGFRFLDQYLQQKKVLAQWQA